MEVLAQDVVNVGGIGGDEHVHIGKPRTFKQESSMGEFEDISGKIMETVGI